MSVLTQKEKKYAAKLIRDEVSYFNGWGVSEEAVQESCEKALKKVERYLERKFWREYGSNA
jgi:hypothetical protein